MVREWRNIGIDRVHEVRLFRGFGQDWHCTGDGLEVDFYCDCWVLFLCSKYVVTCYIWKCGVEL